MIQSFHLLVEWKPNQYHYFKNAFTCINVTCNYIPLWCFLCATGTVRIWQANTYRLESTLNYGLERVWSMAMFKGSNNVALGYDEGSILIKVCQLFHMHCNQCITCASYYSLQNFLCLPRMYMCMYFVPYTITSSQIFPHLALRLDQWDCT